MLREDRRDSGSVASTYFILAAILIRPSHSSFSIKVHNSLNTDHHFPNTILLLLFVMKKKFCFHCVLSNGVNKPPTLQQILFLFCGASTTAFGSNRNRNTSPYGQAFPATCTLGAHLSDTASWRVFSENSHVTQSSPQCPGLVWLTNSQLFPNSFCSSRARPGFIQ